MSRHSFGSPLRPKFQTAKRFLSLQVSQAGQVLTDELSNILKSSKTSCKKRRRIVDEIFSTEQSYQEHLNLITTLFLSPMREMSILPDQIHNEIFSNIEAIQNVNRELLVHMETMGIGDAFLALAPFLRLYSTYANNFEKALNTIKEWEKKCPKFAAFKEKQENLEEAKGLKLNALLITPIQRIPRYKMLLENLLWKTSDDHTDFNKLKEAVDQISKVALHINENIRQHENFQKILSIQNSFSREGAPKILAPGRVFLKEGTLLKVGKSGWRSAKERTFFLFSDILIYSKKNNEKESNRPFLCLQVFPLQHCKVHEVMGDGNANEGGALFSIECQDKSLLLFSKSQGEAKSWLNEIRKTIDSTQNSGQPAQEPRRAACNDSRRGIRRAPARKNHERKQDSGNSIRSPMKNPSYPLGCLSPNKNKELLIETGEPSQLQRTIDTPPKDKHGEYSRLATRSSSETSSVQSLHDSLEGEEKENKTRGRSSEVTSTQDHNHGAENLDDVKDKVSGMKRKLDESDAISMSSNVEKRKKARIGGWLFACGSNFEKMS
ncbi:FYVE, RhoGEF and PH domain-containing protein 4-like [Dendronephthya gigantea]|uniref:FYVE, RhoGEF and PH domain-containing protein 4-like n=1 Tax=Dendronephthya gigantea TaxID=151771 RepID=UPI00106CEBED|nr:FYVE, RhoGEF and PH domain-containing protein 4-like [Dendronephthya gigantea]